MPFLVLRFTPLKVRSRTGLQLNSDSNPNRRSRAENTGSLNNRLSVKTWGTCASESSRPVLSNITGLTQVCHVHSPNSSLVTRFAETMRNDPELRNETERLAKIV